MKQSRMKEPSDAEWAIFWEYLHAEVCKCLELRKEIWIARTVFGCSTVEWLKYKQENEEVARKLKRMRS